MKINFSEFVTKAYWHQFITYKFWFTIDRVRVHYMDWAIGFFGLALVIVAAVLFWKKRATKHNPHVKKLIARYINFFVTTGLLLGFWFSLRWQNVTFFGSKFVAGLIILSGLIWVSCLLRYQFKKHNGLISDWEREQQKQKYLQPNRKN